MQSKLMNHVSIGGMSATIFKNTLVSMTQYGQPHEFLRDGYTLYRQHNGSDNRINGMVFKLLVCEILKHAGATPFYCATNKFGMSNVPNASFDVILFDQQRPVAITCTASLRERWRQAEFKSQELKRVYQNAESYLVTRDDIAAVDAAKNQIASLDDCVHSERQEFTDLVNSLAQRTFTTASPNLIPKRAVP